MSEPMSTNIKRKKKVSKKNKKSWLKHIDNKDVEDFLDLQRLEERLGGAYKEKKDDELFVVDGLSDIKDENKLSKKERSRLPLKCFANLRNNCKIPDPVGKRTRVKTKEERKCRIRKSIEESLKLKGIVQKKVLLAQHDRLLTIRKKRQTPKGLIFNKDPWEEKDKGVFGDAETSWLNIETIKHHTGTIGVSIPKDINKKKSVISAVEAPHPGLSYNPAYKDHQDLLESVAKREQDLQKEEARLHRATTAKFEKVTPGIKQNQWFEEMSQGLIKEEEDNEHIPDGPLSFNPSTNFLNKKTLKQRRKQKEQREAALNRKYAKIEKKKTADIYKVKFIQKKIDDKEAKEKLAADIRENKEKLKVFNTKRLGKKKFVEPDLDFNRQCEIKGNLRNIRTSGNLLTQRYYSLQKRNILEPTSRVTRFKKSKVKKFTKLSHKPEDTNTLSNIKKKLTHKN